MNQGYVIAKETPEGEMGQPIGNEDGAIMLFDDYDVAKTIKAVLEKEEGPLSIFIANISFGGKAIA